MEILAINFNAAPTFFYIILLRIPCESVLSIESNLPNILPFSTHSPQYIENRLSGAMLAADADEIYMLVFHTGLLGGHFFASTFFLARTEHNLFFRTTNDHQTATAGRELQHQTAQ